MHPTACFVRVHWRLSLPQRSPDFYWISALTVFKLNIPIIHGVVLSTVREAADKDYLVTVLSDCCANNDDEVHRVLINKIFPGQADILTAGEWSNK